eukprot:7384239-Prymnesium_polylepis.1
MPSLRKSTPCSAATGRPSSTPHSSGWLAFLTLTGRSMCQHSRRVSRGRAKRMSARRAEWSRRASCMGWSATSTRAASSRKGARTARSMACVLSVYRPVTFGSGSSRTASA